MCNIDAQFYKCGSTAMISTGSISQKRCESRSVCTTRRSPWSQWARSAQLDNMEVWSGETRIINANENQGARILMAPDFEVFGYHNQNHILIFMSPGFWYVHVVEWCPRVKHHPTALVYQSTLHVWRAHPPSSMNPHTSMRLPAV